jgi:hypothetical protein
LILTQYVCSIDVGDGWDRRLASFKALGIEKGYCNEGLSWCLSLRWFAGSLAQMQMQMQMQTNWDNDKAKEANSNVRNN